MTVALAQILQILAGSGAIDKIVELAHAAANLDKFRADLAQAAMAGDLDRAFDKIKDANAEADDFIENG